MPQRKDALNVFSEEHRLDSGNLWFEFCNNLPDFCIQDYQPLVKWLSVINMDGVAACRNDFSFFNFQEPVSAKPASRINSQDSDRLVSGGFLRWVSPD
jgi:hypothetical protein